jgi:hypothetical protein
MQTNLKRGNAAFRMRGIGLSVAILASTTLSLSAPDRALAACGASSRPAGVHPAGGGTAGVHAATGIAAPSGGGGGGGGSLGCANGASGPALRGLPTAGSGRVVERGAHATHNETHARTATTRTANAGMPMRAFGHGHRP